MKGYFINSDNTFLDLNGFITQLDNIQVCEQDKYDKRNSHLTKDIFKAIDHDVEYRINKYMDDWLEDITDICELNPKYSKKIQVHYDLAQQIKNFHKQYEVKMPINYGYRKLGYWNWSMDDINDALDLRGHWNGMAIDINYTNLMHKLDINTGDYDTLEHYMALFDLESPFESEPWHFRYVGKIHYRELEI